MRLPNGVPLVNASDISIKLGERVLVSGPSGSGKSTLFRALAGVWPFGSGVIVVPREAKVMILPQRPYFPIAPLAAAVAYPAEPGHFDTAEVASLIAAVGLPHLAARVDEEAHWNRMLSLGEQQRLGIARAILHAPDYLFLDEATASLDEPAEAALYRLLEQRLAQATIVSIGHRSTLAAFHRRRLRLYAGRRGLRVARRQPVADGRKEKGRRLFPAAAQSGSDIQSYFRLPSVSDVVSLATKAAPHQFDSEPVGLIAIGVPPG